MKKICILFVLLILAGCVSNTSALENELDNILSDQYSSDARMNNYGDYINYYLPSDVVEESYDDLSISFDVYGNKIYMNINVADVINQKYYNDYLLSDDGFFDPEKLVYSFEGSFFKKNDDDDVNFEYKLYSYGDTYYMHLITNELNMYGVSNNKDIALLTKKMYQMSKAVSINKNKVLLDYSSKEVIDYQKSTVNLFENVLPSTGRIDEFMIGTNEEVLDE